MHPLHRFPTWNKLGGFTFKHRVSDNLRLFLQIYFLHRWKCILLSITFTRLSTTITFYVKIYYSPTWNTYSLFYIRLFSYATVHFWRQEKRLKRINATATIWTCTLCFQNVLSHLYLIIYYTGSRLQRTPGYNELISLHQNHWLHC